MAVYLVRHGENQSAADKHFGDGGLSARGREQAAGLRERLADLEFRAAIVSPLRRAGETARILLDGRDLEPELVADLAEGSIGDLAGLSREDGISRYPQFFHYGIGVVERLAAAGWTAPGGEPRDIFLERARRIAERVRVEAARSGHLLVVSHGGLLNYALQYLLDRPVRDDVPFAFENCGVACLQQRAGAPGYGPFFNLVFVHPDPAQSGFRALP